MKLLFIFFNKTELTLAIENDNIENIKLLLSSPNINPNIKLVLIYCYTYCLNLYILTKF